MPLTPPKAGLEFRCPKCQGSGYADVIASNVDVAGSRFCTSKGCDFQWVRDDDWKVFVLVWAFRNGGEYSVAVRATQGLNLLEFLKH